MSELHRNVSLEVHLDPTTKRLLANPYRCSSSTLLDVTLFKPNDGQTVRETLTVEQVRKLLANLEKKRRQKQKMLNRCKFDDTVVKICKHNAGGKIKSNLPVDKSRKCEFSSDIFGKSVEPLFCEIRKSLRNVETKITNMQDINLIISQTTCVESRTSQELFYNKRQQRDNRWIKSCPTSYYDLKNINCYRLGENGRCDDFQKFLDKNRIYRKEEEKQDDLAKKCMCRNCGIVGLLAESQRHPLMSELHSSRAPMQNGQDFDNLSYIYQLSKRVKQLEERLAIQEEKSVQKDYFKRIIRKIIQSFSSKLAQTSDISMLDGKVLSPKTTTMFSKNNAVNPNHVECFRAKISYDNLKKQQEHKSTLTDDMDNANVWRWGEEVLKPGIDLKNRIVVLLNDILSKFNLTEKVANETVNNNARRNVDLIEENEEKRFKMRRMSQLTAAAPSTTRASSRRSLNRPMTRMKSTRFEDQLDEPSVLSSSTGKQEFYKIISRAKASQKEVLWTNIWNQARANGQTKNDKITIKIPAPNGSGGMCEIELAIKEVEEVLQM